MPVNKAFKQQIVGLLNGDRIMTIATNRADGWPQATVVGYANDGLIIYCLVSKDSQKFANIARDPRVSLTISRDVPQPLMIRGLSIAARAEAIYDQGEIDHVYEILLKRYPEYKIMPQPNPQAVPLLRITPEIVSILDYSKGFGHTDLVKVTDADLAEFVEARRHHWASFHAS